MELIEAIKLKNFRQVEVLLASGTDPNQADGDVEETEGVKPII